MVGGSLSGRLPTSSPTAHLKAGQWRLSSIGVRGREAGGGGQRRSQVSLAGGADRIPGRGINLNTGTYKMSRQAA